MRDAVAKLTALVDTAGRFRRGVAPDPAGKGELLEETLHPGEVFALVRIDLGIAAFEVRLRQDRRRPVPGATDVDGIQIVLVYQPVEMDVGKGLASIRPPMAQQPRLYMLQGQRLSQQGVGLQVKHTDAQIKTGTPVGVDRAQLVGAERGSLDRRARHSVGRDGLVRAMRLVGSDGSSHNPDAPDLSGRRAAPSYAGLCFSSMTRVRSGRRFAQTAPPENEVPRGIAFPAPGEPQGDP